MTPVDGFPDLDAGGELHKLAGHPSIFLQTLLELLRNFSVRLPRFVCLEGVVKLIDGQKKCVVLPGLAYGTK